MVTILLNGVVCVRVLWCHWLTHSLTNWLTNSLTHSLTHPPTHPPTHSLTHSPTHLSHPPVPMMSSEIYKPSFFSKFIESHIVMAEVSRVTVTSLAAHQIGGKLYNLSLVYQARPTLTPKKTESWFSLVPRPPPLFVLPCIIHRNGRMGKTWEHSSREWTRGGCRGEGLIFNYLQTKLKSEFLTGQDK